MIVNVHTLKRTHAHTHTHLICVHVRQGFSLNISKGQERKQRESGYQNLEQ